MSSVLRDLTIIKENTLQRHYDAALSELKDLIKQSPHETKFYVYSGCESQHVGVEVAKRLNMEGVNAEFVSGYFNRYIKINIDPETLIAPIKLSTQEKEN